MKRRILAVVSVLALAITLLTVGLLTGTAESHYETLLLQDFESENVNTDANIWAGGAHIDLAIDTTVHNTGDQSVKLTMGGENEGQVANNVYPTLSTNNWTDYDGVCYWIKVEGEKTNDIGGGVLAAGRVAGYVETAGKRYTVNSSQADIYALADGSITEVALEKAGDGRYWLPADFSGRIRIPFSSLLASGEALSDVDMTAVSALALEFIVTEYTGNTYYMDTVSLYRGEENLEPDTSEPDDKADPLLLQDFESENINADAHIWDGGAHIDLTADTTVYNTGKQSLKLTMGGENEGQVGNNVYPTRSTNDFTDYNGVYYWIKAEGQGRIDCYIETDGKRYMTFSSLGADIYALADGSTTEVALEKAGDNRYWLPAGFSGRIRIPFTSLFTLDTQEVWTDEVNMENITDLALGFVVAEYTGNTYYMDTVSLYKTIEEPDDDTDEPDDVDPLMLQNFEAKDIIACLNRWADGAFAELSLAEGKGVNGSTAGKIDFGEPNAGQPSMVLYLTLQNKDLSAGKTLMIYAENPQTGEDGAVAMGYNFEETGGERWYVGAGKKVYLVSVEDGKTEEYLNGADSRIVVPAGFKGWIVIPETSIQVQMGSLVDGEKDFSNLNAFLIDADVSSLQGKSVYIDDIHMSEASANEVLAELVELYGDGSSTSGTDSTTATEEGGSTTATEEGGSTTTATEEAGTKPTSGEPSDEEGESPDTGVTLPVAALAVLFAAAASCVLMKQRQKA